MGLMLHCLPCRIITSPLSPFTMACCTRRFSFVESIFPGQGGVPFLALRSQLLDDSRLFRGEVLALLRVGREVVQLDLAFPDRRGVELPVAVADGDRAAGVARLPEKRL